MSQVKAKLNVVLMADSVVVAEVDDPRLWQQVLNVINGDAETIGRRQSSQTADVGTNSHQTHTAQASGSQLGAQFDSALAKFADFLQLDSAVVEGACSPSVAEPYLHLNSHCWEAFKNQVNNFSGRSIPPTSMAATILLCWARFGGIATITQVSAGRVLATISLRDPNAARGLKGTSWLSLRSGGAIILNPAEVSKAQMAARCFCKKDWTEWNA